MLVFFIFEVTFLSLLQAFQSADTFLYFLEIIFLLYEHCLSQVSSKSYFDQTCSFSIT